jgi:dienelactone hydrolase
MARLLTFTLTSVMLLSALFGSQSWGQQEEPVRPEIVNLSLPVDGSPTDVVSHIYKPGTPGVAAFPVIIFSHGNVIPPNSLSDPINVGVANWWLQRGFAIVAPVRPGYGKTSDAFRETQNVTWQGNSCISEPTYEAAVLKAREVVLAAVAWAQSQPWAKRDRILLVGHSTGGLITIASAATNPEGVVAGINFAGGMGGNPKDSPRQSCEPERLTAIYRQFGKTTHVSTLWLYAENDLFWGVDMPKQWFEAFKSGGNDAMLVQTPPAPGEVNGHNLINTGGPLWKPSVEAFLQKLKL